MPLRPAAWRLFIALPLPADARRDLDELLAPYRAAFPAARWLEPDSWHVTLLFLGYVDPARVGDLQHLVDTVADEHEPFTLRSGPGGGRGRDGHAVAWLGLSAGGATVDGLASRLAERHAGDEAVAETGGLPRRTPAAHLTVARRVDDGLIRALRARSEGPLAASWVADRVALYRSHLQRSGPRYETFHEARLAATRPG